LEKILLGERGLGHGYFSAEKFLDPGSAPSRLRLSSPYSIFDTAPNRKAK
jgi:hypothetical protein